MALAVSLTALALAASALVFFIPDRRVALRRRVMVNTLMDNAYEGVLVKRTGELVVLKDVTLHGPQPVKVDGDLLLERNQIEFIQVLA